jgi:hypothetical protein
MSGGGGGEYEGVDEGEMEGLHSLLHTWESERERERERDRDRERVRERERAPTLGREAANFFFVIQICQTCDELGRYKSHWKTNVLESCSGSPGWGKCGRES